MSPCDEYLELISARLDGELSPFEEKRLEAHLEQCAPCRALADELADLHDAMADQPRLAVPAGLTEQICAAVAADTVTSISAKKKKDRVWKSLASLAAVLALAVVGAGMYGFFGSPDAAPGPQDDPAAFAADPGVARVASFPDQDVLALCAAQLFPDGKLSGQPVYQPETSALELQLTDQGALTLTCLELDPEGVSTVELTYEDGASLTYLVDLIAGTVTAAE